MKTQLLALLLLAAAPVSGLFLLDDVMTQEEQQKTGIARLTAEEKQELTLWLNLTFIPKPQQAAASTPSKATENLYLSENIDNGKRLRLNDGSLYEISPEDEGLTGFWITPFPIKITESHDPNYPYLIINVNTGTGVKAKQITPPTVIPPAHP